MTSSPSPPLLDGPYYDDDVIERIYNSDDEAPILDGPFYDQQVWGKIKIKSIINLDWRKTT